MTNPSVTSVSFDKSSYNSGDTITATVNYTSANNHGGDGEVEYNFGVTLTDELTDDTGAGSSSFVVNSGPVAPNPVELAASAGLTPATLAVTSPTSGNVSSYTTDTYSTDSITVTAQSLVVFALQDVGLPGDPLSVSGLGLTWVDQGDDYMHVYTAYASEDVSGSLSFSSSVERDYRWAEWAVVVVTGVDPTEPFVSPVYSATGSATSVTTELAAASGVNNKFLSLLGNFGGGNSATPDSAWQQLAIAVGEPTGMYGPAGIVLAQVSSDSTATEASASWTSTPSGGDGSYRFVVMELNALDPKPSIIPDWTLVFNNIGNDGSGTAVFEAVAP